MAHNNDPFTYAKSQIKIFFQNPDIYPCPEASANAYIQALYDFDLINIDEKIFFLENIYFLKFPQK